MYLKGNKTIKHFVNAAGSIWISLRGCVTATLLASVHRLAWLQFAKPVLSSDLRLVASLVMAFLSRLVAQLVDEICRIYSRRNPMRNVYIETEKKKKVMSNILTYYKSWDRWLDKISVPLRRRALINRIWRCVTLFKVMEGHEVTGWDCRCRNQQLYLL